MTIPYYQNDNNILCYLYRISRYSTSYLPDDNINNVDNQQYYIANIIDITNNIFPVKDLTTLEVENYRVTVSDRERWKEVCFTAISLVDYEAV